MKVLKLLMTLGCVLALLVALPFAAITYQLNQTALNAEFVERQVKRLDLPELEKRLILGQLSPAQQKLIGPGIERALAENRSIILDQLPYLCLVTTQFVRGAEDELLYNIDREPLRKSVRKELRQVVAEQAAGRLHDLTDSERERTLDAWTDDLIQSISIPDYVNMEDLPKPFLKELKTARSVLSPFNGAVGETIFACLVLTGLLCWLGSMRTAGILLTAGGLLAYFVGICVAFAAEHIIADESAYFGKEGAAFIQGLGGRL